MFGIGLGELILILIIFGVTGAGMLCTIVFVVMMVRRKDAGAPEDRSPTELDHDGTP